MELRKYPRFAVQLPVSFSGDHFTGEGIVFNLSKEGCALGSEISVPKGAYMSLSIHLSDEGLPVEVELAAVRWRTDQKFGVEFIRLKPEAQERLRQAAKGLETGLSH
jgi:hypothetical protein